MAPTCACRTKLQALYREHVKDDADTAAFLEERRADDSGGRDAKA
jgi:hypothetical protein